MNLSTIIEKIKKTIRESFRLFVAAGMLWGLLYIRLIPRVSRDLWEYMNYSQLSSLVLRIFLVGINIYFLIRIIKKIKSKKKSEFFQKLTEILLRFFEYLEFLIKNIYQFCWYMLDKFLIKFFNRPYFHYDVVRKLAYHFVKKKKFKICSYCLIGIVIIPRIIFLTAFTYDVFIQQHLHYTFKCLPLLLIPLVESFFLLILKEFVENFEEGINSFMKKERNEDSQDPEDFLYSFASGKTPDFVKDLDDFYYNHYSVMESTKLCLKIYDWLKYDQFPYYKVSLGLSLVRLIGLVYMLIYGIF